MLTLGELAAFMTTSAARSRAELTLEVHKVLGEAAKDAEAMIGTERADWPALAESTVEEKTRLGYVGHVSDTDPLLRAGELRGSIESDAERSGSTVSGVIGSNSKIAAYQEMGTSRIPPRPFLSAALIQVQPKFEEELGLFAVELLSPGVR